MNKRKSGILALIILTIVWGSVGIPIRYLSNHFLLFQQIYLRLFASAVLGLLVFYKDIRFKRFLKLPKHDKLILTLRIISFYGLGVTLYTQAFTLTSYSNVSFLGAMPTTAVLGFVFLQEKVTIRKIIFIFIAFLGVLFITIKDYSHFFSWKQGDELALLADLFFSLSYVSRKWQTNYLNNKEISIVMITGGFILLFLMALITRQDVPQLQTFGVATVSVIIVAGILNIASVFLINYGFKYVESFLASNIISLESFFAVIFGFIFYREIPTIQAFLGGLLIIVSVVLLNKEEEKKNP